MVSTTTPTVHMGALAGGEAREVLAGNPVILLPMGSHEDQGPHAPMGDYLLAEAIAQRIALRATERGTRTLVAPVLPFGGADYFGSMPGGIAISQTTLRAVLTDMFAWSSSTAMAAMSAPSTRSRPRSPAPRASSSPASISGRSPTACCPASSAPTWRARRPATAPTR